MNRYLWLLNFLIAGATFELGMLDLIIAVVHPEHAERIWIGGFLLLASFISLGVGIFVMLRDAFGFKLFNNKEDCSDNKMGE